MAFAPVAVHLTEPKFQTGGTWEAAPASQVQVILMCSVRESACCGLGPQNFNNRQWQEKRMSMMSEFKEFALKGNVMDLAVGVIIGGAFGKIVDSIVGDLIMPIVSKLFGGLDFSSYYIALAGQAAGLPLAEAKKAGAVLAYGNFITIALNFIILAFIIFMMVKQMNRLKKEAPAAAPAAPAEDIVLLREIRDSLRK
jgi:large conductance mechanosensitive channel